MHVVHIFLFEVYGVSKIKVGTTVKSICKKFTTYQSLPRFIKAGRYFLLKQRKYVVYGFFEIIDFETRIFM